MCDSLHKLWEKSTSKWILRFLLPCFLQSIGQSCLLSLSKIPFPGLGNLDPFFWDYILHCDHRSTLPVDFRSLGYFVELGHPAGIAGVDTGFLVISPDADDCLLLHRWYCHAITSFSPLKGVAYSDKLFTNRENSLRERRDGVAEPYTPAYMFICVTSLSPLRRASVRSFFQHLRENGHLFPFRGRRSRDYVYGVYPIYFPESENLGVKPRCLREVASALVVYRVVRPYMIYFSCSFFLLFSFGSFLFSSFFLILFTG